MRVADLLKGKPDAVMMVEPTLSVEALAARLRAARVGVMLVSRDGRSLDGIVSERDVAYGLAEHGATLPVLQVADLMTRTVITCSPQDTVAEVAKVMTLRRIRHLPVKEGDAIVGVISIGDVLKSRISEIELEANVLRDIAIAVR
ncbi:CBS domain-containing protein [Rhodoplanes sp. TEM]|uniref:CBS domain-containing protein n=1 Tax=Rhodoplanes tepidamans TaxID=200616 RepID=A0ABT5J6V6_RHOTP|nr:MULTISPECIES: CBS domain-containing protein [Rhodoplanes]MDC7785385.1 CBS domain-containing protein [Rhodoplanes tepidamans]MDC7984344.1 CBS domain-containing protein [Rhodoplanes sp. TEM]MDQ0353162.1 CBS domain-containing protein [Rhodoplanes tepidamans]